MPEPEVFGFTIRAAERRDLPSVREIYNHYVHNSVITFDERPWTHREWRAKHEQLQTLGLPFLVAVSPREEVLGYALAQPWASKSAFRYTAEESIYLGPGAGGKGLGTALLQALIDAAEEAGLRELIAIISDTGAEASIRLHRKLGFKEVGRMGRVGHKFGRDLGTVSMQRSLQPRRQTAPTGRRPRRRLFRRR